MPADLELGSNTSHDCRLVSAAAVSLEQNVPGALPVQSETEETKETDASTPCGSRLGSDNDLLRGVGNRELTLMTRVRIHGDGGAQHCPFLVPSWAGKIRLRMNACSGLSSRHG